MNEEICWYWLNNIYGIGRKTIWNLTEYFGSAKAVYEATKEELEDAFIMMKGKNLTEYLLNARCEDAMIASYNKLTSGRVKFIYPDHVDYPERFRYIPDPPAGLYLKGALPDPDQKAIAIIGARSCTRYGMEMARYFGRELAKCGITVISGLARGVDGKAHQGALEADGFTVGILGSGIDQVYPVENYELFMQMEQKGGILSESNMGIKPSAGLFPQRNRLIAGLCDGILVVEAMEKSGTFITVDQGLEQGKEIFAIPGKILDKKSMGCNHLIKLGAHLVTEVRDILEVLHIQEKKTEASSLLDFVNGNSLKMSLAPVEKMVYSCLRIEPRYVDDIIAEVQVAPQEVCKALNKMTLNGLIIEAARNYYAIKV